MSRCCCQAQNRMPYVGVGACNPIGGLQSNCCNFPCFIILILILLQFGKKQCCHEECNDCCEGKIDKGILFIIALYYLSCCNPCSKGLGCGC